MTLAKGINAYLAYGGEVTHGTIGALDIFNRIVSESLVHIKEPFKTESLADGWHDDIYYSAGRNEGDVVLEEEYTGHELFWWSLFGTYVFGLDTPVAGAHTHTFTFVPSTNTFPVGISIQAVRGIGGTDEMNYLGMHVTKAVIEFANRAVQKTTFSMFGTGFSQTAATSPTFATFNPILPAHASTGAGTISIGGNVLSILGGTIEIEVPRANDREHYGQTLYKEAVIVDRPICTFSLSCEFNDATGLNTELLFQNYLDEDEVTTVSIIHEGGIIVGATNYKQAITGVKAWVTGDGPSVQGPGIVPITINGEITEGLSLALINDTGAVVT